MSNKDHLSISNPLAEKGDTITCDYTTEGAGGRPDHDGLATELMRE